MTFLDQPREPEQQPSGSIADGGAVALLLTAAASAGAAASALVRELIEDAVNNIISFPVRSTCVSNLEYSITAGAMRVTLTDGSVWLYPSVSPVQFIRFLTAPSKGQFFNAEVRGRW